VFYFQKTGFPNFRNDIHITHAKSRRAEDSNPKKQTKQETSVNRYVREEIQVCCSEISALLETEDGKQNAQNVYNLLENDNLSSVSGSSLGAASLYYLHVQDYDRADKIIACLEKKNTGAFTRFLRGEYLFLLSKNEEAEKFFHEASVKDRYFWPAFYRIAVLSADGNKTRYEYKIKKTIESIESMLKLNTDGSLNYECFLGGFSPDYFIRILEKKLT